MITASKTVCFFHTKIRSISTCRNQYIVNLKLCRISPANAKKVTSVVMYDFLLMRLCICTDWRERAHPRPPSHVLLHWLQRLIQRRHQLLWQAGKYQKFVTCGIKQKSRNTCWVADAAVVSLPPGHPVLHSDQDCDVAMEG